MAVRRNKPFQFNMLQGLNARVANSWVGLFFKLRGSTSARPRDTDFITEIKAGISTFLAMSFIIAVNSALVAESGATCECNPPPGATGPALICVGDVVYSACKATIRKDMVTATSVVSGIGSLLMKIFANLPIGLSCGMGINVYFVYNVVGFHGSGGIPYRTALAAVFIEGLVFIALTLMGIRQWIARLLPNSLKHATCVGIGLFLCFVGFRQATGIGLVGPDPATFVTLSGCTLANQDEDHVCKEGIMQNPTTWLGLGGLVLITFLIMLRVRGAMLVGILVVSILSWIRHTNITYFPDTPEGDALFANFSSIVGFHPIQNTLAVLDFDFTQSQLWIALLTMLYVDILDATGTIFSLVSLVDIVEPTGDFEGATTAFLCDAASISIGSLFGVPPVTAFLESGVGISEGGRTGIVAVVVSILFFISIFFSPIFASFPPWATGPALIVVGSLMARCASFIPWEFPGEALPAFLTIAVMPLSFSVAYGILAGIISYAALSLLSKLVIFSSRGRIRPLLPPIDDQSDNSQNISFVPSWIPACKTRFKEWKSKDEGQTV
ncbi:hypothetical protein DSO57_1024241 [Entomophthora muscae]|uniref:Uncharacterized protein n=1 Tax=Entomophthora muscae TaxID=34485 RepID=A0ACC2UC51_9FUNG|nr:hypothetical protein DSO57_1024241 [Entomophthora muscae]